MTAIEALHALGGLAGLRARPSITIKHEVPGGKRGDLALLEANGHRRKVMREAMDRVRRLPIKELLSVPMARVSGVGE